VNTEEHKSLYPIHFQEKNLQGKGLHKYDGSNVKEIVDQKLRKQVKQLLHNKQINAACSLVQQDTAEAVDRSTLFSTRTHLAGDVSMEPYYHVYIMNVESNVCNLLSKIFRKQN
jgi:hypothetical protein